MSALHHRALLAFTAASLLGCGPDLVWYGHGADRRQRFEIRQRGAQQWLVAGARSSARYDAIATQGFARSARGSRTAFAAVRRDAAGRERWQVLLDLEPGRAWDAVAALQFDPLDRHLAYLAQDGGRWRAVVDDRPGPRFDAIEVDSLCFSPDGARFGYVASDGACRRVVIDRYVGRCVRAVRGLALGARADRDVVIESDAGDPSTSRVRVGGVSVLTLTQPVRRLFTDARRTRWVVSLAAQAGGRARLVGPRGVLAEADELGDVVFTPDGASLAYTLREGELWYAALDTGGEQAPTATRGAGYRAIDAPVFSADGRRWGYLARSEHASDVVLGGQVRVRVPNPTATALALGPHGTRASFVYRDAHGPVLVVDRDAYRFDVIIEGSLRFDARGEHWAVLAGELSSRELFVVVDGRVRLPFDADELFGGGLGEGDVVELLGRWVYAELARYLERGGREGSAVPAVGESPRIPGAG